MVDVIELLNEAAGFTSDQFAQTVRQFWQDGYDVVRDAVGGNIKVMIGDAFLGVDVSPALPRVPALMLTAPTVHHRAGRAS
jgi:hypothetical protein